MSKIRKLNRYPKDTSSEDISPFRTTYRKYPEDTEDQDELPNNNRYTIDPTRYTVRSTINQKKEPKDTESEIEEGEEIFNKKKLEKDQNNPFKTYEPSSGALKNKNPFSTFNKNLNENNRPTYASTISNYPSTQFRAIREHEVKKILPSEAPNFHLDNYRTSYRPSSYMPTYKPSVYGTTIKTGKPKVTSDPFAPIDENPKPTEENYVDTDFDSHYFTSINGGGFTDKPKVIPVLSYMELPKNCKYYNPILSPSGLYLACIVDDPRENDEYVIVWEMNYLSAYKHKFTRLKVTSIAFTPDSLAIIIVYKETNPVIYKLKDASKMLQLQPNGEEGDRKYLDSGFLRDGKYFGYASDKGFSLWSMSSGNLLKYFKESSPLKKIYEEHIAYVDNQNNCTIYQLDGPKIFKQFQLKGVSDPREILDCQLSLDLKSFVYVVEEGLIRYTFDNKEFYGIQKFKPGTKLAFISDDCKYIVKSNMNSLHMYDTSKAEPVVSLIKGPFKDCSVSFENGKFLIVDNNSITIHDFVNDSLDDKIIWLDKNPENLSDLKFTKDGKVFIAKNEFDGAIAYNIRSNRVIKKWNNIGRNGDLLFKSTPNTLDNTFIATKESDSLIKIWDADKGKEVGVFFGYNANSFFFTDDGKFLLVGGKKGKEMARLWNLDTGEYQSYDYLGNNQNTNTVVNITSNNKRIICCSEGQQPLILNTETGEVLFKCECKYNFDKVTDIQRDSQDSVFLVKGTDKNSQKEVGILYRLYDGKLIENYDNLSVGQLSEEGYLLIKSSNINNGNIGIVDLSDLFEPKRRTVQLRGENIHFLKDQRTIVSKILEDKNTKSVEYSLFSALDGREFASVKCNGNIDRDFITFVDYDDKKRKFVVKILEFLDDEESLAFNRKHIDIARAKDEKNIDIY